MLDDSPTLCEVVPLCKECGDEVIFAVVVDIKLLVVVIVL